MADWPARLHQFLDTRQHTPFAWGYNDCCLFAAAAIEALTGRHPAPALIGAYHSALGARRASLFHRRAQREQRNSDPAYALLPLRPPVIPLSSADPFGVLDWPRRAGLRPIPLGLAGRGDLVAIDATGARHFPALAICAGAVALAPGRRGLERIPRPAWLRAWRV